MVSRDTVDRRQRRAQLTVNAKRMRREPTPAELKFWYQVRDRRLEGLKFRRQVPVGPFIADFICIERHLIVEIDGGQHAESEKDARRDAYLTSNGYRILRFWNADVLTNMDGVIDTVLAALVKPPHPALTPGGERGHGSPP